jgi:hypothetical protein
MTCTPTSHHQVVKSLSFAHSNHIFPTRKTSGCVNHFGKEKNPSYRVVRSVVCREPSSMGHSFSLSCPDSMENIHKRPCICDQSATSFRKVGSGNQPCGVVKVN